jgi:phospholipase C
MSNIAHVVVLMLENRSFDSMLGRLYPASASFDGLGGAESNPWNGSEVRVWTSLHMTQEAACIPTPDPNELFVDMTEQIFGAGSAPGSPASMAGFVQNYMRTPANDPRAVMHGFTPEQLPVLSTLARSFGVSDRWHASAPNQTWPNRFFVHTGTAAGYVNNALDRFPFQMPTIFNRLTEKQRSWRIYYHDIPHTATLSRIWSELPDHLYSFEDDFLADARAGRLPNYSFIEPRYFANPILRRMPNDQHSPHDVRLGERLIARVYDALRNGSGWEKTLFIITYDEHGGIYDHVPPPAAVPPDDLRPDGFAFDRYGVRVPAVIVSPWIPAGSVIRPPSGARYPFDHTSILATLRKLFDLGAPLSEREAVAPDLLHALSLDAPDNPGPESLQLPSPIVTDAQVASAALSPPNSLQQALGQMGSHLPAGNADIPGHASELELRTIVPPAPFVTAGDALAHAEAGMRRFLVTPKSTLPGGG